MKTLQRWNRKLIILPICVQEEWDESEWKIFDPFLIISSLLLCMISINSTLNEYFITCISINNTYTIYRALHALERKTTERVRMGVRGTRSDANIRIRTYWMRTKVFRLLDLLTNYHNSKTIDFSSSRFSSDVFSFVLVPCKRVVRRARGYSRMLQMRIVHSKADWGQVESMQIHLSHRVVESIDGTERAKRHLVTMVSDSRLQILLFS